MADANSRRSQRQRKTVHYDESDGGEDGPPSPQKQPTDDSEDDFAESPLERRQKNKAKAKDRDKAPKQRHEAKQAQGEGRRLAVHERQFEKDLQKAMELSKTQAVQVISLDSDEDSPPPRPRPTKKGKENHKQTASPRQPGARHTQEAVDTSSQEASQDQQPLSGVAPIPPSPEDTVVAQHIDTVPAAARGQHTTLPDRPIKPAHPVPTAAASPAPAARPKPKAKPSQPNENNVLHARPGPAAVAKTQTPGCVSAEKTPGDAGTRAGSTYSAGAVRRVGLSRHHRAKPLHPYLKQ